MRGRFLLSVCAIASLFFVVSPAFADEPVAHWPFDGDYTDVTGNGNDGAPIDGVLGFAEGISGQAVLLDGGSGYVALPQTVITTNQLTVAAWAFMNELGGGIHSQNAVFVQRDNTGGPNHSYIGLWAGLTTGFAAFDARSSSGSTNSCFAPQPAYGEWHHFVGVVSEDSVSFYIDGELVDSVPNTQSGDFTTSIDHVDIGRHRWSSQDYGFFNGLIDDVRVYDEPLSASEVRALYLGSDEIFSDGFETGDTTGWTVPPR